MLNKQTLRDWKEGSVVERTGSLAEVLGLSVVKGTGSLAEFLGLLPSTHRAVHNYLEFQLQASITLF